MCRSRLARSSPANGHLHRTSNAGCSTSPGSMSAMSAASTEARKIAGWCETHYVDLMPHNPLGPISTAACVHLAAATSNFAYLSISRCTTATARGYFPGHAGDGERQLPAADRAGSRRRIQRGCGRDHQFEYWAPPRWSAGRQLHQLVAQGVQEEAGDEGTIRRGLAFITAGPIGTLQTSFTAMTVDGPCASPPTRANIPPPFGPHHPAARLFHGETSQP